MLAKNIGKPAWARIILSSTLTPFSIKYEPFTNVGKHAVHEDIFGV